MADAKIKIGQSYNARKHLFAKGLKNGRLTVQEIEEALPPGTLTAAERWLLYYSLKAAEIEILDEVTGELDSEPLIPHEGEPAPR
ncbi:MAG: RNA polymerase sigma factor region1.1 domain-containing protein [Myxococcaceae bacterium]